MGSVLTFVLLLRRDTVQYKIQGRENAGWREFRTGSDNLNSELNERNRDPHKVSSPPKDTLGCTPGCAPGE